MHLSTFRVLALCAAATIFLQTTVAPAATIGFDADGTGPQGTTNIDSMDWAPGNALADGGNAAVFNFLNQQGSTAFDLFFQAKLSILQLSGQNVTPANLGPGGANELTLVTAFSEVVNNVAGSTAEFGLAPVQRVNYFEIYWDPTRDANDLAGTGFNQYPGDSDAILILSGRVVEAGGSFTRTTSVTDLDRLGPNNYPAIDTVVGFGGALLTVEVEDYDTDFFKLPPGVFLQLVITGTQQRTPFNTVDPSAQFLSTSTTTANGVAPTPDGAGAGTLGTVNGAPPGQGGGPDFQFLTDAESSFTVVPEPASMTLLGIGAFGFGLAGIRRRRSADTQA